MKMSYKVIDSVEGITEGTFLGSVHTYEVVGVVGDSVRFDHSNSEVFSSNPKSITITLTTDGSESTVQQHSWQKVRAVTLSGVPSFFVASNKS
jgi:hypothetical protein